ncbi:putative type IV conjugative transfer system protein TraL [Coprococcus sp. CAG:782]|nr:putative type IV conjugative transfer system protein TraL [Coprococcus sp. CAG:782]
MVEGISRKIVRLKKYEEGIYNTEEYQHFAVIHVRLPRSGNIYDVEIELNEFQVQMAIDKLSTYKIIYDVEIELNEFQVQMAIDKLSTYKIGEDLTGNISVNEHKENETVI